MPAPEPVVSVVMLAYQHAAFIREAVESVLAQRTDFPLEILVGDDASRDATPQILRDLDRAHPGRLTLRLRPQNIGANANFADLIAAARGEFIAVLEGDDHWLGTTKLQSQVDFLRAHPDCALCFHDVLVKGAGPGPEPHYCRPKPPAFTGPDEILARNYVPTCSTLFRRALLPRLPESIRGLPMQDWPSWSLLALQGRIAYLDETWGCYRVHGGGAWSSQPGEKQLRNVLRFYATMRRVLPARCRAALSRGEKPHLASLVATLVHYGRWREARPLAWHYLTLAPGRFRPPAGQGSLYLRLLLARPSRPMRAAPAP